MEPCVDRYLESLESHLSAWRFLAQALQEGCASLVEMDLAGIYRQISRQVELCAQIRTLTEERYAGEHRDSEYFGLPPAGSLPQAFVESLGPVVADRSRLLARDLAVAQEQVRRWNRVLKALLARSTQTVNLRANALVNCFVTYPSPQPGRSGARP